MDGHRDGSVKANRYCLWQGYRDPRLKSPRRPIKEKMNEKNLKSEKGNDNSTAQLARISILSCFQD